MSAMVHNTVKRRKQNGFSTQPAKGPDSTTNPRSSGPTEKEVAWLQEAGLNVRTLG